MIIVGLSLFDVNPLNCNSIFSAIFRTEVKSMTFYLSLCLYIYSFYIFTFSFTKCNSSACNTPRKNSDCFIAINSTNVITPVVNTTTTTTTTAPPRIDLTNRKSISRDLFPVVNNNNNRSYILDDSYESSSLFINSHTSFNSTSSPSSSIKVNLDRFNDRCFNNSSSSNRNSSITTTTLTSTPKACNNSYSSNDSVSLAGGGGGGNRKNNSSSSFCLGDFLSPSPANTPTNNNSTSKRTKRINRTQNLTTKKLNQSSSNEQSSTTTIDNNRIVVNRQSTEKPIRRVVPTSISLSNQRSNVQNEFQTSSFHSDNNLLSAMVEEKEKELTHSPMNFKERDILRREKETITKDFQESESLQPAAQSIQVLQKLLREKIPSLGAGDGGVRGGGNVIKGKAFVIDLKTVTNKNLLDRLIEIHSIIIDLNLPINILVEISYLLNLINTEIEIPTTNETPAIQLPLSTDNSNSNQMNTNTTKFHGLLKNFNNCLYFALGVLTKQKNLLALMDTITIKVLIDNDRLKQLDHTIHEFLVRVHGHKMKLETYRMITGGINDSNGMSKNVFYQQENDTKDNFPTSREFHDFRKQRDVFYTILK